MKTPAFVPTNEDRPPRRGVANQELHAHQGAPTAVARRTPDRATPTPASIVRSGLAHARRVVQLALLRTRRSQLQLLRQHLQLFEPDALPLLHCEVLLAQVDLDISLLLKQCRTQGRAA